MTMLLFQGLSLPKQHDTFIQTSSSSMRTLQRYNNKSTARIEFLSLSDSSLALGAQPYFWIISAGETSHLVFCNSLSTYTARRYVPSNPVCMCGGPNKAPIMLTVLALPFSSDTNLSALRRKGGVSVNLSNQLRVEFEKQELEAFYSRESLFGKPTQCKLSATFSPSASERKN